jgi:hypothetical protein
MVGRVSTLAAMMIPVMQGTTEATQPGKHAGRAAAVAFSASLEMTFYDSISFPRIPRRHFRGVPWFVEPRGGPATR